VCSTIATSAASAAVGSRNCSTPPPRAASPAPSPAASAASVAGSVARHAAARDWARSPFGPWYTAYFRSVAVVRSSSVQPGGKEFAGCGTPRLRVPAAVPPPPWCWGRSGGQPLSAVDGTCLDPWWRGGGGAAEAGDRGGGGGRVGSDGVEAVGGGFQGQNQGQDQPGSCRRGRGSPPSRRATSSASCIAASRSPLRPPARSPHAARRPARRRRPRRRRRRAARRSQRRARTCRAQRVCSRCGGCRGFGARGKRVRRTVPPLARRRRRAQGPWRRRRAVRCSCRPLP